MTHTRRGFIIWQMIWCSVWLALTNNVYFQPVQYMIWYTTSAMYIMALWLTRTVRPTNLIHINLTQKNKIICCGTLIWLLLETHTNKYGFHNHKCMISNTLQHIRLLFFQRCRMRDTGPMVITKYFCKNIAQITRLFCLQVFNDHIDICDVNYLSRNESKTSSTCVKMMRPFVDTLEMYICTFIEQHSIFK